LPTSAPASTPIRLRSRRLARQVERLRAVVVRQHDLLLRIERLAQAAAAGMAIDDETFFDSIEATTAMEKYFSPEQMQQIRERGETLGAQRIREVEQSWPDVVAGMQAALALDKDPACEEVQALARRWCALVREFTGGDAGMQRSLNAMVREEPVAMQARTGIDPALMAYAGRAVALLSD
jgi:hypothetical protein